MTELIGVYKVDNNPDVHLVELRTDISPDNFDVGQITQEVKGLEQLDWQTPWDEKYLDNEGQKIIGDYSSVPSDSSSTRLVFFFHFLDFKKGLRTQDYELVLSQPTTIPDTIMNLEHVQLVISAVAPNGC